MMEMVKKGEFTILDLFDTLPWFRGAADWTAWRAFLCALYALPMTDQEFAIYQECTGRKKPPSSPAIEAWCPTGRRARKSAIAALIGVFEGGFRDYTAYLAPGERATIPILGKNKTEAEQIHTYAKAILFDPSLHHLLEEEPGAETIKLTTRVDLRIRAVSLTAGRSKTIPLALLDELAFFAVEGAVPDIEVVRGIKPGMATVPDAKMFGLSSPYGMRGILYDKTRQYHPSAGEDEAMRARKEEEADRKRVLVWKAPTLRMHDTPQLRAEVAKEYAADPVSAAAEYGAEFREDADSFVLERVLDQAIVTGRFELAPDQRRPQNYFAFVDPSGGSSDSLTLAIAHFEPDNPQGPPAPMPLEIDFDPQTHAPAAAPPGKLVLDLIREWRAPFKPEDVAEQAANEVKRYGLGKVTGDQYGGQWVPNAFRRHRVTYFPSIRNKSQIYLEFLHDLNSGHAVLLDHPVMRAQFLALDRRVARGGRESVDHTPGGHDDVANAVGGACVEAKTVGSRMRQPTVATLPPTSVQEIHRRKIAESLARSQKAGTPGNTPNPWRRGR